MPNVGENERGQLATMTHEELVSYWNILQFGGRMIHGDDEKAERHFRIVTSLLQERSIPYEEGKLINKVSK